MKIGFFHAMLRLLCCALVLFPHYALAGTVNIPGFKGTVTPRSPAAAPAPPAQSTTTLNIPGFYRGATVPYVPPSEVPVPDLVRGSTGLNPDQGDQNTPGIATTTGNVTVYQNQQNAIINWQRFNIGSDASVRFYQGTGTPGTNTWKPNSSYAALNRIWDLNPSQIYGNLTADGKIFLINQNGILFAPGSRINVNSLVASALNIRNSDFLNNTLHFYLEQGQTTDDTDASGNPYSYSGITYTPNAIVSNQGEINPYSADGGYYFLIAPRVENYGTINAPVGQIGLIAAGADVLLMPPDENDTTSAYHVTVNDNFNAPMSADPDFGRAVNSGNLNADGGKAGMYGNNVDNWGVIRSVTAFQNNKGQVELRAANKITTGADSSIDLHVDDSLDPKAGLVRTVDDTFDIQPIVDIKGLVKYNPASGGRDEQAVNLVDLEGSILAPTGIVTVAAAKRVYLGDGSRIDVSGVKADLPLPLITDLKLNSVELRDDYAQKDGVLQGGKITTSETSGSAIGDLTQAYLTRERTALERSVGGAKTKQPDGSYKTQSGEVNITASNADGDIIVKQGAVIDISGGVINYAGGTMNSTKLLSGTKIYDISNAPLNIQYDTILGNYTKTYDRFGMRQTYSGLYYGGAAPILSYVKGYTQGGDAGKLTLSAPTIVLDGRIDAGVMRGIYQNNVTDSSLGADALALSIARGLEVPQAGTLTVQNASSLSIKADPGQQAGFINSANVDSYPQQTGTTVLSAKTLNAAGLRVLDLSTNGAFETEAGADLILQPGGEFKATAARIDHEGSIKVSGGKITMIARDIIGVAAPSDKPQRIVLGAQSSLDVSGEHIDNSRSTDRNAYLNLGLLNGGSVVIKDKTDNGDGVFMASRSKVDVSGGTRIDQKGKVTGGSAGSVDIQGVNIMLEGDLRGYALADPNGKLQGGAITLTAGNSVNGITVAPAASIPTTYTWSNFDPAATPVSSDMKGKLYLADNKFDNTGFTRITLNSMNNVTIAADAVISPSLVRLNTPVPGQTGSASPVQTQGPISTPVSGHSDLVQLNASYAYMAGPSSFSAKAGQDFEGADETLYSNNLGQHNYSSTPVASAPRVTIDPRAAIYTTPSAQSTIALSAPGIINMAGTLDSPGGQIKLTSQYWDVTVEAGAKISVAGTNLPDPGSTPKGYDVNKQPLSAGSVALSANGTLDLKAWSLIDISGYREGSPKVVENRMQTADGNIVTYSAAGDPGSLSLSYGNYLNWNGEVKVNKAEANNKGGSLSISRTNSITGLQVNSADIKNYQKLGFDDLTLKSRNSLVFSDNINASFGRKLTLDAPVIAGSGQSGQSVSLNAPWIVLTNSWADTTAPSSLPVSVGSGGDLTLGGQWIDVIGYTQLTNFKNVTLDAGRDIRLSEALYNNNVHSGELVAAGNLVLDADRVYPGNYYSYKNGNTVIYPDIYSDFTVYAPGTVTVRNTHTPVGGPIYSAGGNLTVTGLGGIDVGNGGYLAAPLGAITLSAPGQQIYLAAGSRLTTAANVDEVNYGGIDPNNIWVTENKTNPTDLVFISNYFTSNSLPQKGVTLNADTTVAMTGSVIDVSGKGSVFAYKFQPGVQGSVDPLTKPNRYVAIKSDSFAQPGQTIDLKGAGLNGKYTLLPLDPKKNPENARYAFMPGAYIIEAQSSPVLPGAGSMSKDGYPLAIGYTGVADTSIRGTRPQVYSVRMAAEVLATEGNYVKQSFTSGDGGNISITGNTIVLNGSLIGKAMTGYHGGKLSLGGLNITVQKEAASEVTGFKFGDPGSNLGSLQNTLTLSTDGLSGQGFREVDLGDVNGTSATNSITVKAGADLAADTISLGAAGAGANSAITLEAATPNAAGAKLTATTGDGQITLATPGTLLVDTNATVQATKNITLDVNNVDDIRGKLVSSGITLKSNNIFFVSNVPTGTRNVQDLGLYLTKDIWKRFTGYQDITLVGRNDIQFRESTTLSAANSLTLDAQRIVGNGNTVTVAAQTVNLKNSGSAYTATSWNTAQSPNGHFTVTDNGLIKVNQINVGNGDVLFSGFNAVNLNSHSDVTFQGAGSLTTGNADLHINAARVTTSSVTKSDGTYQAANFHVYTGNNYKYDFANSTYKPSPVGTITFTNSNNDSPGTTNTLGGILEFWGKTINNGTGVNNDGVIIQVNGGDIKLVAMGSDSADGIFMHDGAQIIAAGTYDSLGGIIVPGGNVTLSADTGKIVLDAGSGIDVSGAKLADADAKKNVVTSGSQLDAGSITLLAPQEGVAMNGALSGKAGQGTDASGNSLNGRGGSFNLYTDSLDVDQVNQINRFTALNDKLQSGGFTESLDLRAKTGNIDIASGETVQARQVKLTADDKSSGNGQINVNGAIDADTVDGSGRVELYATNNININDLTGGTGKISARGTGPGAKGGDVILSSEQGTVNVYQGGDVNNKISAIDVSSNGGKGGTAYLRAQRNNNDVNINLASGSLAGAAAVYAEAFKRYDYNAPTLATSGYAATWLSEAASYYSANTAVSRLQGAAPAGASSFHLLPGIEVINTGGDIKVDASMDLSSMGADANPGTLTLRATGNLNITQNLTDHPTTNLIQADPSAYDFNARNSWGFNLVAGADMSSADYLAVIRGNGNLKLLADPNNPNGAGTLVYTESAPINFASGGNTVIGSGVTAGYMINTIMTYNLASYTGAVHGNVGQNLVLNGGVIQTATGDIGVHVGRDLQLNTDTSGNLGAVRTTGRLSSIAAFGSDLRDPALPAGAASQHPLHPNDVTTFYWRYFDGGNIALSVGGAVGMMSAGQWYTAMGSTASPQWDSFSKMIEVMQGSSTPQPPAYGLFSANYGGSGTRGLATMGGGNLSITTGGDFFAQTGTFGDGDLTIYSGGDIRGRFLNKGDDNKIGHGEIHAMGNFGASSETVQVELFNSQTAISALGDMQIGAIVNPDLASGDIDTYRSKFVKCSFTPDTKITMKAGGDVTMAGIAPFYHQTNSNTDNSNSKAYLDELVLPATVSIDAGRDINLLNNFTLASSPNGNLRLAAAGDIKGSYGNVSPVMMMSDIATDYWYNLFYVGGTGDPEGQLGGWITSRVSIDDTYGVIYVNNHGYYKPADAATQATAKPLHTGDTEPIVIQAGNDISDMIFFLPKKAEVTAGRDITNIVYEGQNIDPADVSMIKAGRNISMQYVKATTTTTTTDTSIQQVHNGLIQGGPGAFMVEAGGSIDLGSLQDGIQAIGNGNNPMLGPGASSLFVLAGYDPTKSVDAVTFFNEIRNSGDLYTMLLYGGKREDAEKLVNTITAQNDTDTNSPAEDALVSLLKKAGGSQEGLYQMLTSGGDTADADALLQDTRTRTIGKLTPSGVIEPPGSGIVPGDINMTSSQIATSNGKAGIYVISDGDINLGQTALPISGAVTKKTGITTGGGGGINIFAKKDVNVQESRVMTFFSRQDMVDNGITEDDIESGKASIGDITIWSDQGSINAGRGSRTAVSASPPKRTLINGTYVTVFTPPSVGSGLRAATYGNNPPTAGTLHLFAPSGGIDAGEAGIAGGQVILAALKITNAANISFSSGSIGMPQQSAGAANIGTLSGSGSAAQNSQLTSGVSGLDTARSQAAQLVDDIIAKWLEVKVVDFVEDGNNDENN